MKTAGCGFPFASVVFVSHSEGQRKDVGVDMSDRAISKCVEK